MGRSRLVLRLVPGLMLAAAAFAGAPTEVGKETARMAAAASRAWKIALPPTPADPLSRDAAIDYLDALRTAVAPKARIAPVPVRVDPKRWPADPKRREKIRRLAVAGYLAPFGPLAIAKPGSRIKAADWGDAFAFALARSAELLHVPSRKYSPSIMD